MTTETYDKKPKLPAGLKLEGDGKTPALRAPMPAR